MDQREFVKPSHDGKPGAIVIVTVLDLQDPDKLLEESRIFKSIVLDWFRVRGSGAGQVQLAAISEPLYHGAIVELFEALHAGEISLRPVFENIPFRILLHDRNGILVNEKDLLPDPKREAGVMTRFLKKLQSYRAAS